MSQYADMLTLLDGSLTNKEFDHCIANRKLIHDCKTKGFKTLQRMGLIVMPEKGETRIYGIGIYFNGVEDLAQLIGGAK